MKQSKLSILFRKQLKTELPLMQSEGLITEEQAGSISQRYKLTDLATEATGKLLMAIYLIGSFLIAVGIISFVAYHWNAIGKALKLSIIFTAMLASHGVGFYLWKVKDKFPKLGHSLIEKSIFSKVTILLNKAELADTSKPVKTWEALALAEELIKHD